MGVSAPPHPPDAVDGREPYGRPHSSTEADVPTVVIVGGGYAGAHAARRAVRAGARHGVRVVVIGEGGRHPFAPRYAAVAAGRAPQGDLAAPLTSLLGDLGHRVEEATGRVVRIDHATRTVHLDDGRQQTYDALVVTAGAGVATPPVAGLAEHARPLGSVEDVVALRAELTAPYAVGDGAVVVVGGGATGVQLAAEVAHSRPDRDVTLVELSDQLLPGEPRSLGRAVGRLLRAAGVTVHLGRGVAAVDADGARLDDGRRLPGIVVWAGGWRADGNRLLPQAPTHDGRLAVGLDLEVAGYDGVFAAGDVASHRDALGRPLPMSAQIAAQAGEVAGHNAVTWLRGRPTKPAILLELGRVLDLGGGVGVARMGPLRFTRRPLDRVPPLLHLAIDVRHLWQVGRLHGVVDHAPGRSGDTAPSPPTTTRTPERSVR